MWQCEAGWKDHEASFMFVILERAMVLLVIPPSSRDGTWRTIGHGLEATVQLPPHY